MRLHGFWRSTASWRVRITLAMKGLDFEQSSRHLRRGEQTAPDFLEMNPQGLVPVLELDDGAMLSQSLAICEYLEELYPEPSILPGTPRDRSRIRALAHIIACDVHPIQNLKILSRLRQAGFEEASVNQWACHVIDEGLDAYEQQVAKHDGRFSYGDEPTLADICLVPQLGNARRFGVELRWPRIMTIETACLELDAFRQSIPDRQPDAE